jgi:hypothetical protein
MSTRESIWCGEANGKCVHLYFELADREIVNGRMVGAPIYIAAEGTDSNKQPTEVAVRLPKEVGQALLAILSPNREGRFEVL